MEYILFSLILIITLVSGILIGLYMPIFILKYFNISYYKKTDVQDTDMAKNNMETKNITPDIMDEWFNGIERK